MNLWIVAAVEAELNLLRSELKAVPVRDAAGLSGGYRGRYGDGTVYLGVTGIGVVSASIALTCFASSVEAASMIMIGSAGSFSESGLNTGDLAVASSETMAELGVCSGPGMGDSDELGLPEINQTVPLDSEPAGLLERCAQSVGNVRRGRFLTVMGVSADVSQAEAREQRFQPLVENMEGYALARVGNRFGIRVGEVRGVSNRVGIRDKSTWDFASANERAQAAVLAYLRRSICNH